MPRFDGTGPQGRGPMTGRGMGKCAGAVTAARPGQGRGTGRGFRWYCPWRRQGNDAPRDDQNE